MTTDIVQMVVPHQYFMLKELRIEASMAYHDKDFKETVDAFIAGKLPYLHSFYAKIAHITIRQIQRH
jgi:(R,R)-butanediol dehydrogenase/meso-butanediol dehydrogenase/diacetyl reductase